MKDLIDSRGRRYYRKGIIGVEELVSKVQKDIEAPYYNDFIQDIVLSTLAECDYLDRNQSRNDEHK